MTARAPAVDIDLLELFLHDARLHSTALVRGITSLIADPAAAASLAPELSLAAQSIKSAASIIELETVGQIADEIERLLRQVEDGSIELDRTLGQALLGSAQALVELSATPAGELCAWSNAQQQQMSHVLLALEERAPRVSTGSKKPRSQPPARVRTTRLSEVPSNDVGTTFRVPVVASSNVTLNFGASLLPATDPAILQLFLSETESCTATLSRGLVELDSSGAGGFQELMRAAHSIKGAASIVGLHAVTRLAHAMEDCFVAAQQQRLTLGEHHIDALLAAVDLLSEVVRLPAGGLPAWMAHRTPAANRLGERLQKLATGDAANVAISHLPSAAPSLRDFSGQVAIAFTPAATPALGEAATPMGDAPTALLEAGRAARATAAVPDRVVRVAAQSINRLMGLAGESLIESRRVQGLTQGLQRLKRRQSGVAELLDALARETSALPNARIHALIAEAKERSVECHATVVEQIGELDSYAQRVDDLSDRLYREALKSRMRPFGDGVHGFPRLVRAIARQLDKQVKLQVLGEATDVDRDVLESLDAPLNHLLRNCLDHGIERPEERLLAGKPAQGTVRLEARHQAGMLAITVSDDGRGIDPEKIRSKVIERGLVTRPMAAALSTPELLEFIFLPGFSTAQDVTQISGRGVGLDAVRTAVQAASGVVHVVSNVGVGTSFHLKLPVTRSVMRAVVAKVAGEGYAFPLLAIERVLRVDPSCVRSVGTAQYFVLEGVNIALVSAEQVLGFPAGTRAPGELCVVIVGDGAHRYGVTVDAFLGEHDLVVRPLDVRLGKVQDIAAAAILRDGSPALILDVDDMVRSIVKLAQAGRVDQLAGSAAALVTQPRKRVLVVDDSITVREAERQLLTNHGYEVDVAVDGIDGWNSVRNNAYDLIVSDIDMPRMNGIDMVRTIKQDPRLSGIPIVIVSYKDREEDRMRGLDAGANHYLTKSSFHDDALVQAVENLIGAAST